MTEMQEMIGKGLVVSVGFVLHRPTIQVVIGYDPRSATMSHQPRFHLRSALRELLGCESWPTQANIQVLTRWVVKSVLLLLHPTAKNCMRQ